MDINDPLVRKAIAAANEARARAYAPYSRFKMGAAVLTDRGEVLQGVLVENVSLGLAMCSERVALFSTVAAAAGRPAVLVLSAPTTDGALTWPCGACLQVARELADPSLLVVVTNGTETQHARLAELAPRLPAKNASLS